MKWGALSDLFLGVAWKRLTPHEVDPSVSNGHEFQGVSKLRDLLGASESRAYETTYLLLSDDEPTVDSVESVAKWYDARTNQPHRAPEWRLYYPADAGQVQSRMRAGDLMVLALTKSGTLVVLLARAGSVREAQLNILFGLGDPQNTSMDVRRFSTDVAVGFLASEILAELGLAEPTPEATGDGAIVIELARDLSERYPTTLPKGREIASLIQLRFADTDAVADPDGTLIKWIEAEEALYRLWEDGLIERRLTRGFARLDGTQDVQAFRDFSMSARQSRVSRAGGALQLHAAAILVANKIWFDEQATTENGERPDFLFPSAEAYHDPTFPGVRLRMLAAKFTAKDRWRQVLNEAERVESKHLLTMDAAISLNQLKAMASAKLQPIVPQTYIDLYPSAGKPLLRSLRGFLEEMLLLQ